MIKQLKRIVVQIVAGINICVVVLMLFVGFSDRIDPELHPTLACTGLTFPFFLIANFLFLGFWAVFHWRKLWIPVGGFLLAYAPINIYMPVRVMEDPPAGCLKVVSYNVAGYGGPTEKKDGFDRIFGYLSDAQADIVCLIEDNDTWRHSDNNFAEQFAYNEKVRLHDENGKYTNHISVRTRFPVLRSERLDIPSSTGSNGAVAFYLNVESDTLLLVCCHLENVHLNKTDRRDYKEMLKGDMESDTVKMRSMHIISKLGGAFSVRARQAKAIHQYVEEHRGDNPVIVCGDFNDTPISFVRRTLAEGLADCYEDSGRGLGLSYNQKGFNFRIDHILCSTDMIPYHCQVDTKIDASDHYPLVCWLKMSDKP